MAGEKRELIKGTAQDTQVQIKADRGRWVVLKTLGNIEGFRGRGHHPNVNIPRLHKKPSSQAQTRKQTKPKKKIKNSRSESQGIVIANMLLLY